MAESKSKFKIGDIVYSHRFGFGVIEDIDEEKSPVYPIKVDWKDGAYISWYGYIFTKEGRFNKDVVDPKYDIVLERRLKEMEEDTTLNVNNTSRKDVKCSPINPSHYRVDGIPEAIDIMEHLMTKEQLKGFLWGNIIKYAYRYGRKGDEHDTAGKIEWYANRLKEVCAEEKRD